ERRLVSVAREVMSRKLASRRRRRQGSPPAFSFSICHSVDVHHALGYIRELLIRLTLFVERLLQQVGVLREAERGGEGADGAVAGDLVVLHALRGGDHRGVESIAVLVLLEDLIAFGQQAFHALA